MNAGVAQMCVYRSYFITLPTTGGYFFFCCVSGLLLSFPSIKLVVGVGSPMMVLSFVALWLVLVVVSVLRKKNCCQDCFKGNYFQMLQI
jgi:hypothetical protein